MAETLTQEEMEDAYSKVAAALELEDAYESCLGMWEGRDMSFIENIRGERRTPMSKLLLSVCAILLAVVGLTRLQIVNGTRLGDNGPEHLRYISFR